MSIPPKIANLTKLALSDRVLTYTERKTIVAAAVKEGVSKKEINQYIDNELNQRLKFYTKEELRSCPFCGAQIPLISDDCMYCGQPLNTDQQPVKKSKPRLTPKLRDIINKENRNTAISKHNIKYCPDCGAPFPLGSNICESCGHVLHEQIKSTKNIKKLIDNINISIKNLKKYPQINFIEIIKHHGSFIWIALIVLYINLIIFNFSTENLLLVLIKNVTIILTFFFFTRVLYIYDIKNWNNIGEETPIEKVDKIYYSAKFEIEKYTRQMSTLYGNNKEVKSLLKTYQEEINKQKKTRILTLLLNNIILIILTTVVLIFIF